MGVRARALAHEHLRLGVKLRGEAVQLVGRLALLVWPWACVLRVHGNGHTHHNVHGHASLRLRAYGCVCMLVSA